MKFAFTLTVHLFRLFCCVLELFVAALALRGRECALRERREREPKRGRENPKESTGRAHRHSTEREL